MNKSNYWEQSREARVDQKYKSWFQAFMTCDNQNFIEKVLSYLVFWRSYSLKVHCFKFLAAFWENLQKHKPKWQTKICNYWSTNWVFGRQLEKDLRLVTDPDFSFPVHFPCLVSSFQFPCSLGLWKYLPVL